VSSESLPACLTLRYDAATRYLVVILVVVVDDSELDDDVVGASVTNSKSWELHLTSLLLSFYRKEKELFESVGRTKFSGVS
jgi:hypothetical protein